MFDGIITSKNRVYDSQGNLIDADESAVVTDVGFATSDPGPGDDSGGVFSFRILSESGEVLWAGASPDLFSCFDCPKGHAPITEVHEQWGGPLIRGMAFVQILDKRLNKVLLLLDVRGFVQVFCMNNPCVDVCRPESIDGGSTEAGMPMVHGGEAPIRDAAATDINVDEPASPSPGP
jgi:hypothetical protein